MARGITQDQVNAAIDALVAAGERPTIERVRAALGTGSPNTLTRMLDAWWGQLHDRLTRQQARLTVPDAPGEVAVAATRLWQLALEHAGSQAGQAIAAQRDALAHETAGLVTERASWQKQVDASAHSLSEAERARQGAEARLADLQRLLEQQAAQLGDLQARLASAEARSEDLSTRLDTSQQALLTARSDAASERTALEASHRAAEDRWMQEVDKARLDEARTAQRLLHAEALAKTASEKAGSELADVLTRLRRAEQDQVRKDARIAAMDEQLERLHRQLEVAIARAKNPAVKSAETTRSRKPKAAARPAAFPMLPSHRHGDRPIGAGAKSVRKRRSES